MQQRSCNGNHKSNVVDMILCAWWLAFFRHHCLCDNGFPKIRDPLRERENQAHPSKIDFLLDTNLVMETTFWLFRKCGSISIISPISHYIIDLDFNWMSHEKLITTLHAMSILCLHKTISCMPWSISQQGDDQLLWNSFSGKLKNRFLVINKMRDMLGFAQPGHILLVLTRA